MEQSAFLKERTNGTEYYRKGQKAMETDSLTHLTWHVMQKNTGAMRFVRKYQLEEIVSSYQVFISDIGTFRSSPVKKVHPSPLSRQG